MQFVVEISTEMLLAAAKNANWSILDARSPDAYIGWDHFGVERGGHIDGAGLFSCQWMRPYWVEHFPDWEERLLFQLETQRITPQTNIVVYDENAEDASSVLDYLSAHGYENLFYYPLNQWKEELVRYPHYDLLAPIWWVKDLIEGKSVEHYDGGNFRLFEISWKAPSKTYLETHIPGAVHIDSDEFEAPPEWIRKSDDDLIEFARNNGITPDTTVVIYENHLGGASAKMSAVLRYLGVKHVMCLNGTLQNWLAAGYPTESGCPEKQPVFTDKEAFCLDPTQIVDIHGVKKMLEHPALGVLIDTRAWEHYIGLDSGYDYVAQAGRIPGTIWCFHPYFFTCPDGTMSSAEVMCRIWKSAGIDYRRRMAFFCGSASWGAAIIKLFGNAAGIDNATIYEGGWGEWQLDPNNPYETGIPEGLEDFDPTKYRLGFSNGKQGCRSFFDDSITIL